jgi:hypothetical protein
MTTNAMPEPPAHEQAATPAPTRESVLEAAPNVAPAQAASAPVISATRIETPASTIVDQIDTGMPPRERSGSRRRPRDNAQPQASEPLVFIETAPEKAQQMVLAEEEPQRRRTPRPRKQREQVNEPLIVVETQPGQTPPGPQA